MKTNHHMTPDDSRRVYCHKLSDIVKFDSNHARKHCQLCPYFAGSAGKNRKNQYGVVCEFDDASNEENVLFDDPAEAERFVQLQYVRLGIMTEEEVDSKLKGYSSDNTVLNEEVDDESEEETEERHEVGDGLQEYQG